MKITKLQDIDLSKYKLAYFRGDSMSDPNLCQDDVMKMAEAGVAEDFELCIALIPKDEKLTKCGGDDWDDAPADCNASGFYRYPEGTIFLQGELGKELQLVEKFD